MRNFLKCSLVVLTIFIITACGVSGTKGAGINNNGGATGPTPVTIDNAGVVPVIGQSSTTSVIYVHNNTNQLISGITYSATINTDTNSTSGSFQELLLNAIKMFGINNDLTTFLDPSSVSACAAIPAHNSCPLVFNTPIISAKTAQGSALITMQYQYANQNYKFDQLINYSRIINNVAKGALFNSGVVVYGFGNSMGYGTVYLYGSGESKVYTVTQMNVNKPSAAITQGNITGMQIQSNYVQAVEVSAPTGNSTTTNVGGFSVVLNANSIEPPGGESFSSLSDTGVILTFNGAILTSGLVPLINSSLSEPIGSMYIVNSGNAQANLGAISYPSGVIPLSGSNGCGAILPAGAGCTLYFKVPHISGSGNIVVPYTGGKYSPVVQTIAWYNTIGSVLLQMSLSSNPLVFNATIGGSVTVTATNIGGYDLSNITIPSPIIINGSASASTNSFSCTAGGNSLPVGQSCSYTTNLNALSINNGAVKLLISGDYDNGSGSQSYTANVAMNYIANLYVPVLAITPSTSSMVIIGNNIESDTQTLTVGNNGGISANITSSTLSDNPSYMVIESDACINTILATGATCRVIVKMGPVLSSNAESGTALYSVNYTGGDIITPESATATINYTLQANEQNLSMQSVSTTNTSGGNGESATPYIFDGSNTGNKFIILTYINSGSNPIKITGISNSNSPIPWQIDGSSSCVNGVILSPNAACSVVFKNVLSNNVLAIPQGIGSNYVINLTVPTFVFIDTTLSGLQFVVQPALPVSQFPQSGDLLYVNNHQATVANNTTESSGVVVVQNILANATGYSSITIVSQFESYYIGTPILGSGCSQSTNQGNVIQTCVLTPNSSGNSVGIGQYNINPYFIGASLDLLYSINPHNQTISMTPLAQQVILH